MSPFDAAEFEFASPQVEKPVDPVLRNLAVSREWLSDPAHWCKNQFGDMNIGPTCAWGAVLKFSALQRPSDPVATQSFNLLTRLTGHLPNFNDAPGTTHADVLSLFDRAISARRAELGA